MNILDNASLISGRLFLFSLSLVVIFSSMEKYLSIWFIHVTQTQFDHPLYTDRFYTRIGALSSIHQISQAHESW